MERFCPDIKLWNHQIAMWLVENTNHRVQCLNYDSSDYLMDYDFSSCAHSIHDQSGGPPRALSLCPSPRGWCFFLTNHYYRRCWCFHQQHSKTSIPIIYEFGFLPCPHPVVGVFSHQPQAKTKFPFFSELEFLGS